LAGGWNFLGLGPAKKPRLSPSRQGGVSRAGVAKGGVGWKTLLYSVGGKRNPEENVTDSETNENP
jgi:hypothetical protein